MNRKDKMLVGALVPKDYGKELFDKLNQDFPQRRRRVLPMTYLMRTLLGMWYDGKIVIKQSDIDAYKADRRKTNRYGNQVLEAAQRAGIEAAAQNMPIDVNPYDPESKSYAAWVEGWKSYFSKL